MDMYLENAVAYGTEHNNGSSQFSVKTENIAQLSDKKSPINCRLCLAAIQESNITILEGIIRDMLEIILPELNLSICESPPICKTCFETLKQAYSFKSSCLEVEDKIHEYINKTSPSVNLKQILKSIKGITSISESIAVCRTCLGLKEESLNTRISTYEGDPLQNMFEKCLPEMGLELTKDPSICSLCLEQLEEQFQFIMQCLDTEAKISCYSETKQVLKDINLYDVYLFSITMEESDELEKPYEIIETTNCDREIALKLEDNPIKNNLNIIIKEENGISEAIDLTESIVGPRIKCNIEPYSFGLSFKSEVLNKDIVACDSKRPAKSVEQITTDQTAPKERDECDSDVSVTKESDLLDVRKVTPTEINKTSPTAATIKRQYSFKKDDDEKSEEEKEECKKKRLITKKCKMCDFRTKYVSRMKAHITVNHSTKDANDDEPYDKLIDHCFKCRQPKCNFQTLEEDELKAHKRQHRKEREQKCPHCGMIFIRPDFLKKHIDGHSLSTSKSKLERRPTTSKTHLPSTGTSFNMNKRKVSRNTFSINGQILKMFKCRLCPYQTRLKSNHERHALTHKKTSEIVTHRCKFCNFETIHKENFMCHMQTNHNEGENKPMKCFLCSFQPATEVALRQHVLQVHKSTPG